MFSEGDLILVDRLNEVKGETVKFDEVLLLKKKSLYLGKPKVAKAEVKVQIVDHVKADKIRIIKFRAKSRYHRIRGHRQPLTSLKILKISAPK